MTREQWQAAWDLMQSVGTASPEQLRSLLDNATGDREVQEAVIAMLDQRGNTQPLDRIGQRIGRYVLTGRLGEGGMGEVYAARDSELNRSVAVKLMASTVGPPATVERFIHEAKAASALNHPNIVTIHEVIHASSRVAIVMELVDGTSLRQLSGSPVPIDRLLHMGGQIARALAAAHARGIVHCDIKPENLMVREDGFVKVLDFGLALDLSSAASRSVLPAGTLRYMAPEQSRGDAPTPASDVFSLGIVLYELAAGTHPFERGSIFETLQALNDAEPSPPSSLNPFVSPHLDALILRMLAKDPGRRPTAAEVAKLLESRFSSHPVAFPVPAIKPVRKHKRKLTWVAGALAAIALGGLAWWSWPRLVTPPRSLVRFDVDLGPDAILTPPNRPAISPDETRLAYAVRNSVTSASMLAVRRLDQSQPVMIAGTEGAREPFFSPDGRWIGFFTGQNLKKISINGGAPVTLCPAEAVERGAWWGSDGFIIANLDNSHLVRISENGGTPEMLRARPEDHGERTWRWPQILPGGRQVLFTGSRGSGAGGAFESANLEVLSLETGNVAALHRNAYFGRYLPSGHLVYVHEGTLFAVPLDLTTLKTRGAPAPVLDDVAGDPATGAGRFDFSASRGRPGILTYMSGKATGEPRTLAWINSAGQTEPFPAPTNPITPSISPNGELVAFSAGGNIFVRDLQRGVSWALTRNSLMNNSPVWTPDGKHILFDQDSGDESAIWWVRADGSGEPRKLFASVEGLRLRSISPDGRRIAFARQNAVTGWDIWLMPLNLNNPDLPTAGQPEIVAAEPYDQFSPAFSPDGKWLAYTASEANFESNVYVRPVGGGPAARKWRVSTHLGEFPVWSHSGKELLFWERDHGIARVRWTVNGADFVAEEPEAWSPSPVAPMTGLYWNFDVTPDGKRILTFPVSAGARDQQPSYRVTVLLNFFNELKRDAPQ